MGELTALPIPLAASSWDHGAVQHEYLVGATILHTVMNYKEIFVIFSVSLCGPQAPA